MIIPSVQRHKETVNINISESWNKKVGVPEGENAENRGEATLE